MFSLVMTAQSPNLSVLAQCETWARSVAPIAGVLGGVELRRGNELTLALSKRLHSTIWNVLILFGPIM